MSPYFTRSYFHVSLNKFKRTHNLIYVLALFSTELIVHERTHHPYFFFGPLIFNFQFRNRFVLKNSDSHSKFYNNLTFCREFDLIVTAGEIRSVLDFNQDGQLQIMFLILLIKSYSICYTFIIRTLTSPSGVLALFSF